jgi:hypothetical protein
MNKKRTLGKFAQHDQEILPLWAPESPQREIAISTPESYPQGDGSHYYILKACRRTPNQNTPPLTSSLF